MRMLKSLPFSRSKDIKFWNNVNFQGVFFTLYYSVETQVSASLVLA